MTAGPALEQPLRTHWRPGRPVDLVATLGPLSRGAGDPTTRVGRHQAWRTARTPQGPGTLRVTLAPAGGEVVGEAWGPGAGWLLAGLPALLGGLDETVVDFDPKHPLVRQVWRRHRGWRVPRSERVLETLALTVLEQKVTGLEARRSWTRLLRRYGTPAPGPTPVGLVVAPEPAQWARIPSWEWHLAGVGPERSRTLVGAADRAPGLERTVGLAPDEVDRRLRSLPGVGPWTSAEVRQRAHGDPDAVSVGDFHLGGQVVYALTGREDGDDAAMLELLEPYAGHRYRVVRMVELAGLTRPRRAPRYAPHDHRGR